MNSALVREHARADARFSGFTGTAVDAATPQPGLRRLVLTNSKRRFALHTFG